MVSGSHSAIDGAQSTKASTRAISNTYGNEPRMMSANGASVMALMVNKFIPTGGVIMAISRLITRRTPYQMGLMPKCIMAGKIMGMVIRMMAIDSKIGRASCRE